jgi:hypothetical protein
MTLYTDAPVDYDGFGTTTIIVVGKTRRGDVRHVDVAPDHLRWQEGRYGSGGYFCGSLSDLDFRVRIGDVALTREV